MIKKILCIFIFLISILNVTIAQTTTDEQLAAQYFQNGEFEKAADLYEELLDKNPNPFYYNNLIQSLISAKDYKKAEKVVKKRIRQNPNDIRLNVDLGFVYATSGDAKKLKSNIWKA